MTREIETERRDFARFLSGHVLTNPEVTASWPTRKEDGSKRVLVLHEADPMGSLFSWLEREGNEAATLCIRESSGYSIVTIQPVKDACEAHDDDCGINDVSSVGMFLLYLREKEGSANIHRVDPIEIFARELHHSRRELLLDA